MAGEIIVVGCQGNTSIYPVNEPCLQKVDDAGNYYPHGHRTYTGVHSRGIFDIALDSIGNTYTAEIINSDSAYPDNATTYNGAFGNTTKKRNPDGYVLWEANHGAPVHSIVLDDSGNVYTFGDPVNSSGKIWAYPEATTGYYTTRKYNSSGALQWSANHGIHVPFFEYYGWTHRLCFKGSYLYSFADWWTYSTIIKYNVSTGAIVSTITIPQVSGSAILPTIQDLTVDDDDNIYVAGTFPISSSSYSIFRKYDSSGTILFQALPPETTGSNNVIGSSIAINNAGDIIAGTNYVLDTLDYDLYRYNTNLEYQARGNAYRPKRIVIDSDDNIYFWSVNDKLYKFDSDLVNVWEVEFWDRNKFIDPPNSDQLSPKGIAIGIVETPSLFFVNGLGVPTIAGSIYALSPSLPIPIGIGTPQITRDYVGVSQPIIFRAYLAGSQILSLTIESFSIRSNTSDYTLSIVIPLPSLDLISDIESRIGNVLTLKKGIIFTDGTEQLDDLIYVTFDSIRYDIGSNNASTTLSGTATASTEIGKTRIIKGISYRNENNGIKLIRCEVDTYLKPGDIADLGSGETMTVEEIVISVNSSLATMEISD